MKIYVASSWLNKAQPTIVRILRLYGYDVYDFRNPAPGEHGFHWSEIDPDWRSWTKEQYKKALGHGLAEGGFINDFLAMKWADIFVGVQPFGRSASMEMGWAAGSGKKTILLLHDGEPELMVKMFDYICCDMNEVLNTLQFLKKKSHLWMSA